MTNRGRQTAAAAEAGRACEEKNE